MCCENRSRFPRYKELKIAPALNVPRAQKVPKILYSFLTPAHYTRISLTKWSDTKGMSNARRFPGGFRPKSIDELIRKPPSESMLARMWPDPENRQAFNRTNGERLAEKLPAIVDLGVHDRSLTIFCLQEVVGAFGIVGKLFVAVHRPICRGAHYLT